MSVPNILATRYASAAMRSIWTPENKIRAERRLWLTVMEAQADLGVSFGGDDPEQVLACLLYTSPSPRDATLSRMPSSA